MTKIKFIYILVFLIFSGAISNCIAGDIWGFVNCTNEDSTQKEPATGGYALLLDASAEGPILVDSVDIDGNGYYTFEDPPNPGEYKVQVRCVDFDMGTTQCEGLTSCYTYKALTETLNYSGRDIRRDINIFD